MQKSFDKAISGYKKFREKYAHSDEAIMRYLSDYGQKPEIMIISCCDSRVDPALILQCDPGDLFVIRNVANIVPPYEKDEAHHGTSAALEFGVRILKVKHLILLGHSQCGGIEALFGKYDYKQNDFISNWVSIIASPDDEKCDTDDYARLALNKSHENCLTFPWINEKVLQNELIIHLWFFDIKTCQIFTYSNSDGKHHPLDVS